MGVKPEDIARAIAGGNKVLEQLRRVCPRLPEDTLHSPLPAMIDLMKPKKRIRQSSKPLLNKLETEFLHWIKDEYPTAVIWSQALRFRLANGLWYKPDFVGDFGGEVYVYEVKGPHSFRGGFENLKMAATAYPAWTWKLVWKEGSRWMEQIVRP